MSGIVREWIERRALVDALVRRALIARYRGTSLGFLWSFVHPAILFCAYALVFGIYIRMEVEGSYPAFLCAGLLPWTWFAQAVAMGTTAVLGDAPFVRQGAFSPAVSPLVVAVSTFVNFVLSLPVLLVVLAVLGVSPTPWLGLVPLLAALQLVMCLGCALLLSALCVRYRDTIQLVQALLPILFLLTPVVYPATIVPEPWAWVLRMNPLAQLMMAWQDVFLGRAPDPIGLLTVGVGAVTAYVVGALVLDALRDRIPEEL
jgi:lipopolysaccharide transport system permease protein